VDAQPMHNRGDTELLLSASLEPADSQVRHSRHDARDCTICMIALSTGMSMVKPPTCCGCGALSEARGVCDCSCDREPAAGLCVQTGQADGCPSTCNILLQPLGYICAAAEQANLACCVAV
jgi:hypothetical protein